MASFPTFAGASMRDCNSHAEGTDAKLIPHNNFSPLARFMLQRPVRQASEYFAAETRMKINLTNSEIVVAVALI